MSPDRGSAAAGWFVLVPSWPAPGKSTLARLPGCPAARLRLVPRYHSGVITVERVQTGVRMERGLLKVLKGLAEYLDLSLGDLLEGIVLHAFEGDAPFSPETLQVIVELRKIYGCTLTAADSHQLTEPPGSESGS